MTPDARKLYAVIGEIRASFNLLKSRADEMNRDMGITASMRAVIESLAARDGQTVPDIARAKGVSRQHIQVNVNALAGASLAMVRDNPDDKRTMRVFLTDKGRHAFDEIRGRETRVLESIAGAFPSPDLDVTLKTLRQIQGAFAPSAGKGGDHARP